MPVSRNERFIRVVGPHIDGLYRAAYRLTRNTADAEDLVQEACLRAVKQLDALHEQGSAKPWLLRVLHNLFIDGTRRARHSPFHSVESAGSTVEQSTCTGPTPEESAMEAQRLAQLERAWLRLDRGHRALLALRAEDYTIAEIAAITNIPADAVTMRLYRARQSLARCLREDEAPTPTARMEATK